MSYLAWSAEGVSLVEIFMCLGTVKTGGLSVARIKNEMLIKIIMSNKLVKIALRPFDPIF